MSSSKLQDILNRELYRQQNSLELIASENYVSKAVIDAYANVFTNKYSEGYPGVRYYGGNQVVDELEIYTQQLALQIFGLNPDTRGANVQPLSGSTANLAVYTGLLPARATVLAMDLSTGGHLTHGMKLNASGKYFNFIHYGVDKDGYIDYDQMTQLAIEHKPAMIVAGFSSYPRNIDWSRFTEVKKILSSEHNHDVILMADISHISGLVAGGHISSPFPYFDIVTTTTHKTLRGPRGALIYARSIYIPKINRGVFPGVQGGPFDHVLYTKAVALEEILNPDTQWSIYTGQVMSYAKILANQMMKFGRRLVTDGTDNHMIVMDITTKNLSPTGLTGKTAEHILEYIGISINKQLIPGDTRPPQDPSGVRIGTPAITSRGLSAEDIVSLASIMDQALTSYISIKSLDDDIYTQLHQHILDICIRYPLRY